MAFVVARPRLRWEIRESYATPKGPRARTLVSFSTLTPDVIDRAERAAAGPFDRDRVMRAARRAGTPFRRSPAEALAEKLTRAVANGEQIRPGLRRLLHDRLAAAGDMPRSVDDSVAEWLGVSAHDRGRALVDLLGLTDRLPKPRQTALTFPGLSASRLRSR